MKRKLIQIPPTASIKAIPGSNYIVLNDEFVVLLQTPINKNGKLFYLITDRKGKTKEIEATELKNLFEKP